MQDKTAYLALEKARRFKPYVQKRECGEAPLVGPNEPELILKSLWFSPVPFISSDLLVSNSPDLFPSDAKNQVLLDRCRSFLKKLS